ncbi:hypothetical protein NT01EI_3174 [Edwardsiella ictaluri 93-146]|uniref:Uncharacterized protein n=1 Tax=Edwardsiella ictaluri (strain 93-146) TaxID=634503 RepID=C5BET6_EDWI9|nr:hypothetical protein NT01EI_3174 [Edwardsiella ictaluri 93-146]
MSYRKILLKIIFTDNTLPTRCLLICGTYTGSFDYKRAPWG